ncbi:MAG: aldo/keto reductase [Verrucomicrobia bacterium]|nr:aldo/keto reductase [Verrucomicrobiota bacterium]
MKTVTLGHTGTQVSAMALGAMTFGTDIPEPMALKVLDRYTAGGGSFIDTANIYANWVAGGHGGDSEAVLGRWMQARGNRDAMFIATKVGSPYGDVPAGLRAKTILAECDKSLRRLQTDHVDLYFAHHDDPAVPLDVFMEAFDRLVQSGKVRFLGASNFLAWRLAEAQGVAVQHKWTAFACIQQLHTYLRVHPAAERADHPSATREMLNLCLAKDIAVMAYSPILGGAYDGHRNKPFNAIFAGNDSQTRLTTLNQVAERLGAKPTAVVLAWLMTSTPPVIPLFSASSPEQVDANLSALTLALNQEDMTTLDLARG